MAEDAAQRCKALEKHKKEEAKVGTSDMSYGVKITDYCNSLYKEKFRATEGKEIPYGSKILQSGFPHNSCKPQFHGPKCL